MLVRGPDGIERAVAVDAVVFTGDFIPDNELARLAQLSMDPGTKGPACDADGAHERARGLRHRQPRAPGRDGRRGGATRPVVGRAAAAWLRDGDRRPTGPATVRLRVADPLLWVAPNLVVPGGAATEPLLVRSRVFLDRPRLDVTQGGRLLGSYRLRRMIPNRSHALPAGCLRLVQPGDDVRLSVS